MGIELNNDQIYAIYDLESWWTKSNEQVFEISGAAGTGKAQPIDTIIPTPEGNKKLGELKVGNFVFNRHGKPVKVLGVYDQGFKRVYKVTLSDGRSTLCNDEHLWSYYLNDEKELRTSTLREIMDSMVRNHLPSFKYNIPFSDPVYYSTKNFNTSTYKVGEYMAKSDSTTLSEKYMYGDTQQRWNLIQGIFDNVEDINIDGNSNNLELINNNIVLLEYVKSVLFSLGISSKVVCNTYTHNNTSFETNILSVDVPNEMKSKFFKNRFIDKDGKKKFKIKIPSSNKYIGSYIKEIEDLEYETRMRCIFVDDEEHLYLTNDYIVTHNTTLIRYFIDRLGLSYKNVLFLAFMGKAASQMARNGLPAKTIHSAIYDYKEKLARGKDGNLILQSNGKPKKVFSFELKDHISKKIKLIVVDEASMVDENTALDLLSFGIPIICLGDLNQLPPVFGNPFFLNDPDVILRQIMRQAEKSPVIWLSQQVLDDKELKYGVYGNCAVIPKKDITDFHLRNSDIIITGTNRLRYNINNYCREEIKKIRNLEYPNIGEKVICRKNNWGECIEDNIYMTNGTTGFVDRIDKRSYNKNTMIMDFRPDFCRKAFKNIEFDLNHMYAIPGAENNKETPFAYLYDKMEYAYAITCHAAQGSSWENVLYMHENFMRDPEDRKKLLYTAITRASNSITIVI